MLNKPIIAKDNKGKSGIYLWYNSKTKNYYLPAAHWTLKPTGWGGNLKTQVLLKEED